MITRTVNPVPLFRPARRLALLVNSYDDPSLFPSGDPQRSCYHRLLPSRGNASVFQMEAAVRRGAPDVREELRWIMTAQAGEMPGEILETRIEMICAVVESAQKMAIEKQDPNSGYGMIYRVSDILENDKCLAMICFQLFQYVDVPFYRAPAPFNYEHIKTFFPDMPDIKESVFGALSFYSQVADKDTLTFFFMRAHGMIGTAGVFQYDELLDRLDAVAGKKVMIVLACHSGSLTHIVQKRKGPENYLVMPSTLAREPGVNWNEDEMLSVITEGLIKPGQPLSGFGAERTFGRDKDSHTSVPFFPFDVVL